MLVYSSLATTNSADPDPGNNGTDDPDTGPGMVPRNGTDDPDTGPGMVPRNGTDDSDPDQGMVSRN